MTKQHSGQLGSWSCDLTNAKANKVMTGKNRISTIFIFLLTLATASFAQEGLAGLRHAANDKPDASSADDVRWQPVPTKKKSLANLAPLLLPFFNNGPVFGLPGTVTGSIWERTQLGGDWGGLRTDLAHHGLFLDMYSMSVYQNVTSGGLKTGSSFTQGNQLSINLDTARAGLWAGGLFHFTVQSRYGDNPPQTFTAGSYVPQYTGLVLPDPIDAHNVFPSEYFLVQALSPKFSLMVGKISDVFIPDQTLFGNSFKYDFANFNFLKNPMTTNFYNPTALAGLLVWAPNKSVAVGGGVLDPNSKANNVGTHAFDKVNLYLTSIFTYSLGGLPGQLSPAYNWSNKPKIALDAPFGQVPPTEVPDAVAALLGLSSTNGLNANFRHDSWFTILNASQYLFVKDGRAALAEKLGTGQQVRGVGVFGRLGYAPANSNTDTRDASIALFAHGIFDIRKNDSFGTGFFDNQISNDLKRDISQLTAGTSFAKNERGTEVFYDFAITPAVRLISSYQHIWNPLTAEVAKKENRADVFLLRLAMTF